MDYHITLQAPISFAVDWSLAPLPWLFRGQICMVCIIPLPAHPLPGYLASIFSTLRLSLLLARLRACTWVLRERSGGSKCAEWGRAAGHPAYLRPPEHPPYLFCLSLPAPETAAILKVNATDACYCITWCWLEMKIPGLHPARLNQNLSGRGPGIYTMTRVSFANILLDSLPLTLYW